MVRSDRDSIVIGKESNIQDNAVVHLGSGYPVKIGDHVTIYANASVLGPITVGDHSVVGSNAWVKEDIPPYSRVLPSGTETKIIQRKPR